MAELYAAVKRNKEFLFIFLCRDSPFLLYSKKKKSKIEKAYKLFI